MKFLRIKKKGQILTMDFIIGLLFFLFLLVMSMKLIVDVAPNSNYQILYNNNIYASESLITEGFPLDWNETNVIIPGITSHYRLNLTKLEQYDNLSYGTSKVLLHSNSEYIFFFKNQTNILNITNCIHGYPLQTNEFCEPKLETISYQNLVKTERLIIHDSQIIQLVIYNWN